MKSTLLVTCAGKIVKKKENIIYVHIYVTPKMSKTYNFCIHLNQLELKLDKVSVIQSDVGSVYLRSKYNVHT